MFHFSIPICITIIHPNVTYKIWKVKKSDKIVIFITKLVEGRIHLDLGPSLDYDKPSEAYLHCLVTTTNILSVSLLLFFIVCIPRFCI